MGEQRSEKFRINGFIQDLRCTQTKRLLGLGRHAAHGREHRDPHIGLVGSEQAQRCQAIDPYLVDEVRNFLFGPPGSGGFDLASLNIQRGRDHGLADYNQARTDLGLDPVTSFSEISKRQMRSFNCVTASAGRSLLNRQ